MNKKIILAIIAVIIIVILLISTKPATPSAAPEPTPTYTFPKEIKYDSSTDLKKELDTVNPQVNDSDFKE